MFSVRLKGVKISADIGFFAAAALIMLINAKTAGCFFTACMIHEAGHLLCMYLTGTGAEKIMFTAAGITVVQNRSRMESFASDIGILLSGPLFNIVSAVIFKNYKADFSYISLILGLFNMLPFSALDGGCILELILESVFSYERKNIIMNCVHILNSLICTAVSMLCLFHGGRSISFIIMSVYLLAGEADSSGFKKIISKH